MAVWNGQIRFEHKMNIKNLESMVNQKRKANLLNKLNELGKLGCDALREATPKDTGKTSESWYYKIEEKSEGITSVNFYNSNVNNHVNIAIILQYGHGTRNGGYVQGIDYINPALHPIFEKIANQAWKEVISK